MAGFRRNKTNARKVGRGHGGRLPFTWHYYAMALGALALLMAATLSAWSAVTAAAGFMIISHPGLKFMGLTRQVLLVLLALIYIFAFPSAEEVYRHFQGNEAALEDGLERVARHETCFLCVCPPKR